MARGRVHDAWRVRRAHRLVWADALHLDGDIAAAIDDPAGFDGCPAAASLLLVVDDPVPFLPILRSCLDHPGVRFGCTIVNGILLARWLGTDAQSLRRSFGAAWGEVRAAAAGLPKTLPRLWHV
jgi:urease accessory protein